MITEHPAGRLIRHTLVSQDLDDPGDWYQRRLVHRSRLTRNGTLILLEKHKLPIHTDFISINTFERALAGFNFTAYCDI